MKSGDDVAMQCRARTCLLALTPSDVTISAWTATVAEAERLAEALHDARPQWRVHINGQQAGFSREGKVTALMRPRRSSVEAG